MKKFAFALLLIAAFAAARVTVLEPIQASLDSDGVLDLGSIGPGQRLEIVVDRASGFAGKEVEALWDRIVVDAATLPQGWSKEDAKLYESPLRAFVSAARDAKDGEYRFDFNAFDEYEGAPTSTIHCKVMVSKDLLELGLGETRLLAGVRKPALFHFVLKNKSSASDSFELSAKGLPGEWKETKTVFMPYRSQKIVTYSVVSQEAGEFDLEFTAKSISSDATNRAAKARLTAQTDLYLDMQATSHGILLFPSVQQAVYALFGLVTNLK